MGALLEWLLKKENKKVCGFIGVFLVEPVEKVNFGA
jgi:hypothetical protein